MPSSWQNNWYPGAAKLSVAAVKNTPEVQWRAGDGKSPILAIQAENDRIAPPEFTSRLLNTQFPDRVSVVTIANAGHALLPEQPDAVSQAVLAFLENPRTFLKSINQVGVEGSPDP